MIAKTQLNSIISTKLCAPSPDARMISRRALFAEFSQSPDSKILTVVAAAGSGKSTLLAEIFRAMSEGGTAVGWISLDPDDDTPANFATYLIAALTHLDIGGGHEETLLQGRTPFRDIEPLFKRLLAQFSNLRHQATLFFDDFQHIQNEAVLGFVNKLLSHAPSNLKFVFASRQRIPLDLSKYRVDNRMTEVQQDELSFTSQQASEFLKRSHNIELSPNDLQLMLDTTEGWPTGLQLVALALRRHSGSASQLIQKFSGRDQDLSSYLMEVVLRSQPEAVRRFLLATAPLARMSASLADAVSGHPNSSAMIDHLSRSSLFVIALDREGVWYRYHHLFSTFLQEQLRRNDPAFLSSVYDRAASWCEAQGLTTEAVQYALDGHHYDKACELITTHASTLAMLRGDHYAVLEWMRRLPERYHLRTPDLALAHAWSRAFSRDTDRAISITDSVLSLVQSKDGWALPRETGASKASVARVIQVIAKGVKDDIDGAIDQGIELRKELAPDDFFLNASICNTLGYCHFVRQEFDLSARSAIDAYQSGCAAGAIYATVWADFLHGIADLEMGRVRSAAEHAARAVASAASAESPISYSSVMAALVSAEVAIHQGDVDQATQLMQLGRSFTATFGPLQPLLIAYRVDARLAALRGDIDQARRILMDGQDTALSSSQPRLYVNLALEEVTLRLNRGDLHGALESAERTQLLGDSIRKEGTSFRGERDNLKLLQARLLLAQGDLQGSLRQLSTLQQQLPPGASTTLSLAARATRALALWLDQRHTDAIRELDKVLTAAAPDRNAYPIIHVGAGLVPVLKAISEWRGDAAQGADLKAKRQFENKLLSILSPDLQQTRPGVTSPGTESSPPEELTAREIELLQLIDAGLGNKKMADALLISESTVKWHLHNIYSKIGVGTRTAAAARARELKLI